MKKVESVKQRTFYTAFWLVGSPVVLAGGKMDKMSSLTLDLVMRMGTWLQPLYRL